jgi:O-antigen/teichoic acid export membrane protein
MLRRLLGMLSMLFTGALTSSFLAFANQLILARLLVPGDLGRIAALLATVNFFTPVAGVGANAFLVQAFGREGWAALRWLRPTTQLISVATSVSAAAVGVYAVWIFGESPTPAALAAVAILVGQVVAEHALTPLLLTGNFGPLAFWQSVTQVGRLVTLALAAFVLPISPVTVLSGYGAVGLLTTAIGILLLFNLWTGRVVISSHGSFKRISAPPAALMQAVHGASPFALLTVFYVLYFQGTIVFLQFIRGNEAAAQYNAAFLIISAVYLIPNVIYTKLLFAPLSRWVVHDRQAFEAVFHLGVVAMGLIGVILMVAIFVNAKWLVTFLFGSRYASAGPVLMLLAFAVPVRFVQSAYSSLFISPKDTACKVGYFGIGALVTAIASFGLIPAAGVEGAAAASVLAEVVLLALHVWGAARHIKGLSIWPKVSPAALRSSALQLLSNNPLA